VTTFKAGDKCCRRSYGFNGVTMTVQEVDKDSVLASTTVRGSGTISTITAWYPASELWKLPKKEAAK